MAFAQKMTVEFYRVMNPHPPGSTLEHYLELTAKMQPGNRNVNRDGHVIRLQEGGVNTQFWSGDMIRIRMQHLPVKADLHGEVSSLDLEKDEGLGEETAFFYHIPTRVLIIQRNRNAVTASAFAHYLSRLHDGLHVGLEIIIEEAVMKKLDKMEQIRCFEIQVAALDHLNILKQQKETSVSNMIALSQFFQSPHINISLSMGRQKGTLDRVRETIKKLIKVGETDDKAVEKLKITGRHADDEKTVLDLLEHRMLESIDLPSDIPARFVPFHQRSAALKEAWERREDELLRMFQ
jgi:hypothetical protein